MSVKNYELQKQRLIKPDHKVSFLSEFDVEAFNEIFKQESNGNAKAG